jgi:SseB protein N-terminal domain
MFGFIKNLFNSVNVLPDAGVSGNKEEFVRLFLESDLTLLSLPVSESLELGNLTEDELIALVDEAARKVSEQTEIKLFTFHDGSTSFLPVFTGDEAARRFVEQYVSMVEKVIPFEVLEIKGRTLLNYIPSDAKLVVNPKNPSEYRLTVEDMEALARTRTSGMRS